MTEKNKAQIIEWLYVNDGGFSSKNEWRKKLISYLDYLIDPSNTSNTIDPEFLEKPTILSVDDALWTKASELLKVYYKTNL